MNRKRNLGIGIGAAILSFLLVYGVYIFQLKQIEFQKTTQVVVPKSFIATGTLLTQDLVKFKTIVIGAKQADMLSDLNTIIGKETLMPLGSGEPILQWKLGTFHLLPKPNQSTFQIPKDYILSISNGIRAGDQVNMYVSADEGSTKLFNHKILVASVKNSANVEVDNPKNPHVLSKMKNDQELMYMSRREANGAIEQINLNLTEEEWLLIDQTCKRKKSKLVIAFTSESMQP